MNGILKQSTCLTYTNGT
uniref:Uncharacterized protein n=1 Tax=Anguilla anguilla TaxID=7936 RepID=A0A0E9TVM2_ANGAN